MHTKQLEYFVSVVECNSFTQAAKRCYVSQSAVSQQIRALEDELGHTLLERQGKRFTLTPAGEYTLIAAREMLQRADTLRFDLEHLDDEGVHELNVGYVSRYEGWEIPSAVAAFTVRHPSIHVSAHSGSHEGLYGMLLNGTIDIAFNDRRRELSDEFVNEHLMTCYTVAEISEANPLSHQHDIAVSQLADTPCILISTGEQRAAERDYYQHALNFPSPFLFASSLEEAHLMVAGNRGFLPLEVREPAEASGGVIKHVPLVNAAGQLKRDYYAFWLERRTSWVVKEFAQILRDLFNG